MSDPAGEVGTTVYAFGEALEALWGVDLGLEELTGLLVLLQDFQKVLGQHMTALEEAVLREMPEKVVQTRFGTFERVTSSTKTTWDSPLLLAALARQAMDQRVVDEETGELESPLEAITKAVVKCAAVSYFRLGEVQKYDLDGRKYRETEWGRKRVKVTRLPSSPEDPKEVPSPGT